MKRVLKKIASLVFSEYAIFYVYCYRQSLDRGHLTKSNSLHLTRVELAHIQSSADSCISDQAWYHGSDTLAYAAMEGSRIVALCFLWYGDRYRTLNFWPLATDEAKLVQIVTIPEM